MARDNFSQRTIDRLRMRVACRCSNPSCRAPTVAPGTREDEVTNLGVAAHICAASPGGPRYDSGMSPRERSAITNGIWLCANCATTIDRDVARYSAGLLVAWRESAECTARAELGKQLPMSADETETALTTCPSDADLDRVLGMAATLLEVGKRSWKMPVFVAPLNLETHEGPPAGESRPIGASELTTLIEAGENLVLFGKGGIGKTTLLLELSASCLKRGRCVPLFVDAPLWARTNNANLFEYLAGLPSAQRNGVTSAELTRLAEAGRLVILLNGWNEISASSKLVCRDGLIHQAVTTEALSVVVTSRSLSDKPNLSSARQVEVRGLAWQGQSAVVRAELGAERSAPLLDLLAKDTHLRHAARSPLILRGLIAQARKGVVAHSSTFDLLGVAVQAFEEDDQRNLVLSAAPVDGHQRAYLEELACRLTQQRATNCSKNDALQAVHAAATHLAEHQLIGALPQLTSVLGVLASHHLLHIDDGVVRFAHERFQEYFAANRLLRECMEDAAPPALLLTAVNQPAWDESLLLLAGKLKGEGGPVAARVRMVKVAAAIDLGIACDLTGISALSHADDSELHDHLVARVNELAASPLEEVRDLGVAYQIASGLPAFAEKLWPLLESGDRQIRLSTYRMNGSAISLTQLGVGAEKRVALWSSTRRIEFIHEIADNADNYEFLVALALSEPDPVVRAAAISALFWHFPASDVPFQAWLDAPVETQTEHSVVSYLQYALEEGYVDEAVRVRLQTIAVSDTSKRAQLQLALAFPNEVGPRVLDAVLEHLRSSEPGNDSPLVAIARAHAPERLLDLAREFVLHARRMPDWIGEYLLEAPADVKTDLFERAWLALQGQDFSNVAVEAVGPLADRDQIERCVTSWLQYAEANRGTLPDVDHERHRRLGYLLAHAPGCDLLNVVLQLGQRACYDESAHLLDLVLQRIGRDDGSTRTANQWLPTLDDFLQLVAQFSERTETADVPQDTVRVYLCSVASQVAPAEFGPFLLETCRRHLDARSTFRRKIDQWSKTSGLPRPRNPQLGLYLASALAKWGPDALPGLLKLMAHPSAMEFLPEAIARIVGWPWASKRERVFSSVSTDIQEGELRRRLGREFRQPDETFQHWTDEAAKALGKKLSELVSSCQERKSAGETWNAREAEYLVGRLTRVVASIPSAGVVEPVHRALSSGLMDVYGTVGALRGLVRQGLTISDPAVVGQLEALYEQAAIANWHDNSLRYAMSELSELLICVVPTSFLRRPMEHYLQQWRRFSNPIEIIRHLGAAQSEASWPALLELCGELAKNGRPPEELAQALVSALRPRFLAEFLSLVASGTLFACCDSEWALNRLAPRVAFVVAEEAGQIEAFLEACRQAKSLLADALAGEVLSHIKGSEEVREAFLLETLDAGRAVHPNMPTYRMLKGAFTLKVPVNEPQYEVAPKTNNELRAQLYARARCAGPIADCCRRLLASLECERRESGRPDDELRHPSPQDGLVWTDALLDPQVTH